MDDPKIPVLRDAREKVELTDEQKAKIRSEMNKFKPDQQQEARAHRKFLAKYYDVSVQQIAGVSAYKVKEDGTLSLEPFGKSRAVPQLSTTEPQAQNQPRSTALSASDVISPQIESEYDNPTKRAWRSKIKEAIETQFPLERLRDARVVCLPGRALQEVTDVYLPLGVRPENIICIERDPIKANMMRKSAELRKLPVRIFEGSVDDFLQSPHEPVTIASFDFLGPAHTSFFENIKHLRATDSYMIITNFLQRREQKDSQVILKALTNLKKSMELVKDKYRKPILGSDADRDAARHFIRLLETVDDIEPSELSEARDEGVAMLIMHVIMQGSIERAAKELYAEVNKTDPFKSTQEDAAFIFSANRFMARGMEGEIWKYPRLFEQLTPKMRRNIFGTLVQHTNKGKRGFLQNFSTVVAFALDTVSFTSLRRYEYASEVASSPYQTDIMVFMDWKKRFRDNHRAAYNFIRESCRIFGESDQGSVSMRLEKNRKILPQDHAGSTAKVIVALCVNGTPRCRVALRDLQEMVNYFRRSEEKYDTATTEELFSQPRIKIDAKDETDVK